VYNVRLVQLTNWSVPCTPTTNHAHACLASWQHIVNEGNRTFRYTLPVRDLDVSHLWTFRYQDVSLPPWTFRQRTKTS